MASHDDGSGSALYVAGNLTRAGGLSVERIARWYGTHWASVGPGLSTTVFGLAILDDGGGTALYAGGGTYDDLGSCVARWDGAAWTGFGGGVTGTAFDVDVFDDGNGPALYAAGNLTLPDGDVAVIARWDGTSWESPRRTGTRRLRLQPGRVRRRPRPRALCRRHLHEPGRVGPESNRALGTARAGKRSAGG